MINFGVIGVYDENSGEAVWACGCAGNVHSRNPALTCSRWPHPRPVFEVGARPSGVSLWPIFGRYEYRRVRELIRVQEAVEYLQANVQVNPRRLGRFVRRLLHRHVRQQFELDDRRAGTAMREFWRCRNPRSVLPEDIAPAPTPPEDPRPDEPVEGVDTGYGLYEQRETLERRTVILEQGRAVIPEWLTLATGNRGEHEEAE